MSLLSRVLPHCNPGAESALLSLGNEESFQQTYFLIQERKSGLSLRGFCPLAKERRPRKRNGKPDTYRRTHSVK